MENSYLFVYGTLRPQSGHDMSLWLAQNAHYIGEARLKGTLYQVSYYPGLTSGEDWVVGDVYACAPDVWPMLDEFEGVSGQHPEYERCLTPVLLASGQWLSAWVYWYLHPTDELVQITEGDWRRFLSRS